jgi:hypothetical protein
VIDPALRTALAARLDSARQALLGALEGLTERDFAADLGDGQTVVRFLAGLAAAEHSAVVEAGGSGTHGTPPEKPLPPQVVHDLAGARYRIQRTLDGPEADAVRVTSLVAEVERLEAAAVERIQNRPPAPPLPPQIPVIQR